MIKCNVKVNGTVYKTAHFNPGKNTDDPGNTTLSVSVNISSRDGQSKLCIVNVRKSGDSAILKNLTEASRVEITGEMTFKKRGDKFFMNLSPVEVNNAPTASKDSITGTLEFKGKMGGKITEKKDKKDRPFTICSGYSVEKVGDNFEYTWVRFVQFKQARQTWMEKGVKFTASGKLEISLFKDNIDISCTVEDNSLNAIIEQN